MQVEFKITNPEDLPASRALIERALARKRPNLKAKEASQLLEEMKRANVPAGGFGGFFSAMGWHSLAKQRLGAALQGYLKERGIAVVPLVSKNPSPVEEHVRGLKRLDAVGRKIRLNQKLQQVLR
jgi:hypothetical protein